MRRVAVASAVILSLVAISGARAGGPFDRLVGVGANGVWADLALQVSGPRSELALGGPAVAVPSGGFVRIYTFVGGLPGIPGRLYPASHALCLYWQEPVSNCLLLRAAGTKLLSAFAHLPLRYQTPTTPVAIRYGSRLLRYANGNLFAAVELALERPPLVRFSTPPNAIALTVMWRGPATARMPARLSLTPSGVYTTHRLFPLQRGPWCYLAGNLPAASASVIEATSRICR